MTQEQNKAILPEVEEAIEQWLDLQGLVDSEENQEEVIIEDPIIDPLPIPLPPEPAPQVSYEDETVYDSDVDYEEEEDEDAGNDWD